MRLPRRLTIGLAVGHDQVRAVALRAGRIAWAVERRRDDEALVRTLGQLLIDAPIARWPRARVIAAVGPAHAQTKRLAGLPAVSDRSRLGELVQESAARFFLKNGVPLVTAWSTSGDGTVWGAAVEQPVLEALESACRARHLKLHAILPTVAVLAREKRSTNETERILWSDGPVRAEVILERGVLVGVRRSSEDSTDDPAETSPSSALDALGSGGSRFADAFGAAMADRNTALAWRSDRRGLSGKGVPRWRMAVVVVATVAAATAWLTAPGVVAQSAERAAAMRLTTLAPARRHVVLAEREMASVTAALGEVASFDASRYEVTRLLADLAQTLPDESALTTLRLARGQGSLVALTPRAAALAKKLESIPGIETVEITGPVTREVVAGKAMERVTVRFRLNATARRDQRNVSGGGP